MLQSTNRGDALSLDWATPLKIYQVQYQKVVEPVLTVTPTEDKHHVLYDACSVELAHGCLASDDAWDVESEFVYAFLEVNEDHV